MNHQACITQIYPSAKLGTHYGLRKNGEATEIVNWTYDEPQPTDAELTAAWPAAELAIARRVGARNIRANFATAMEAGITINSITLAADPDSVALFSGLAAMLALGLATGAITAQTPQTIFQADGTPLTLAASVLAGLLLQYGATYAAAFAAMKAEIAAL